MKKSSSKKKTKKSKVVPFNKLSKTQQRIAIAKDVLAQINLKKYVPESGTYIHPNIVGQKEVTNNISFAEIDQLIKENKVTCNVCAKGALFMSHVMKTDNCTFSEAETTGSFAIQRRLNMFSPMQLDLIEEVFESYKEDDLKSNISRFIKDCKNDNDRMVKIMKNIIKNKGTFKL